jgi:hypothetical protein
MYFGGNFNVSNDILLQQFFFVSKKEPQYPLNGTVFGPQSRSERFGEFDGRVGRADLSNEDSLFSLMLTIYQLPHLNTICY